MSLRTRHRLVAEGAGTAALLAVVIGSGIMAERLAGGQAGLALLANTAATVMGLYVLVTLLGPVSGAHFNPLVSLVLTLRGTLPRALLLPYLLAQCGGAMLGAGLAHAMFALPLVEVAQKIRPGWPLILAEGVATAGLILVVLRAPARRAPALVACFIGAAYWFTASTSFANPAAVLGRMLSDTFAGIAPVNAPGFLLGEAAGAACGVTLHLLLGGELTCAEA